MSVHEVVKNFGCTVIYNVFVDLNNEVIHNDQ